MKGVKNMKIHESGENYLEALLMLKQEQQLVRSIDIAKKMDFSKASVSRAVNKLKENGYIVIDEQGFLDFTVKGENLASKIYDRHKFFTEFLIYLGVDEIVAAEDACKIEHVLSNQSYQAMKNYLLKAKNKLKK